MEFICERKFSDHATFEQEYKTAVTSLISAKQTLFYI